jgi:putative ABC transport system permease protein
MLTNYLKVAVRVLLRRKFYTGVNLFGIAFTLLVLILAAALLDNTLAPGAPETRLDRILTIETARMAGEQWVSTSNPGYRLLDGWVRDLPGAEAFSISSTVSAVTSFVDGRKVEADLRRTDGEFWEIMEFEFVEGGPFARADEERGSFVAVVDETTRERFGLGTPAVGKTVRIDGQAFAVVGVVTDVPWTRRLTHANVWVPISTAKSTAYRDDLLGGFQGIVLARRRADFPEIKSELAARMASVPLPDGYLSLSSGAYTQFEQLAREVAGASYADDVSSAPVRRLTMILALLAIGFMLLPSLNLINLSLSRILERSSEIGVRKAFGASSWTLVGQFLVENAVLTLVGGALGYVLSVVALRVVTDSGWIPYADLQLSLRVFFVALGMSLVFALLSGVYPAWRMSRLHPVEALHGRG